MQEEVQRYVHFYINFISFIMYLNITLPAPTIFPLDYEAQTYAGETEITIEEYKWIDTYYSLDGCDPKYGDIYENAIIITESTVVSARNKFLWIWSDIKSNAYKYKDEALESAETSESPKLLGATATPGQTEIPTLSPTVEPTPIPTVEPKVEPKLVSIRDVSEFYSDGIEHRNYSITDNIGNSYDGYTFMVAGDFWIELEGSVVYRNDNQYNRFFGRIIITQSEKNDEDCGWVKIYGDGILLLDTGIMGRGITPVDFDFDISTYNDLETFYLAVNSHVNFVAIYLRIVYNTNKGDDGYAEY